MSLPNIPHAASSGSLNGRLKAFRDAWRAEADPHIVAAFALAQAAIEGANIGGGAVKAGERMPEFALPGLGGRPVVLSGLLKRGPVVVSFYRGDWCDYCTMELSGLKAAVDDIAELGASLVAISPQLPQDRLRADAMPLELLVDVDAKLARRCGIAYALPDEIRPIYTTAGRKPPLGDHDSWLLPVPATYVVDWTGEIVLSYVNVDYTSRLEPSDIIACLKTLTRFERRRNPPLPEHAPLPARWHRRTPATRHRPVKRNS